CTGQEDLLVGMPVANRGRVETEGLIGCFVNILVLRGDLTRDPAFTELLARTRAATLSAFNHQDLPFEKLVEAQVPERNRSQTPLAQVVLSVQSAPLAPSLPGLVASRLDVHNGTAKFELTLELTEGEAGFAGWIEYATDLFEAATVRRLADHYRTLLATAVADPGRRLADLPLLGEAEQAQALMAWNDTASDYPREATLAELFQAQVDRAPGAVALDFFGEQVVYADLDVQANQLSRYLHSLGVGRESLVGVFLDRSADLIVTLLATIKAGGAYVPLDLSYPPERLGWMLEDAGAAVVVTREALAAALPERGVRRVLLDREAEAIAAQSAEAPEIETRAEDLAYVMYTSGSTGRPKGVAIPQRGILRLLLGTDYMSLGSEERIAQIANVSFDVATFEVWGALLHGGCLVGMERELLVAPRELAAALVERRISVAFLTTAVFNQVAREAPQAFGGVGHLFAGGEALDPTWVREAIVKGRPGRMINGYGPTESTCYAACYRVEEVAEGAASVPIGRPIANTTGYVVDRGVRAVPVGVAGELLLGGGGLASVPDGGPGALAAGRAAGLSGADRPPGQGAGLPHRAGGDRDGADGALGGDGGGGPGLGAGAGRPAAGGLGGGQGRHRAGGSRAARLAGGEAAGLHGAGDFREPGGAAADAERQAGPPCAAGAEPRGGGRVDRAAHAGRGATGRDLGRVAGRRAGGVRGRLLRLGRSLAAGGPGSLTGERGTGPGGSRLAALRGVHAGRPGRGAGGPHRSGLGGAAV